MQQPQPSPPQPQQVQEAAQYNAYEEWPRGADSAQDYPREPAAYWQPEPGYGYSEVSQRPQQSSQKDMRFGNLRSSEVVRASRYSVTHWYKAGFFSRAYF